MVPPAEILFLPSQVEAAIGHRLLLPVQVMGYTDESTKKLLAFKDCHSLKVEITTSDVSIFNISVESNRGTLVVFCNIQPHCMHNNYIIPRQNVSTVVSSLVPRPETARRKGPGFHCLRMRLIICNRITYS